MNPTDWTATTDANGNLSATYKVQEWDLDTTLTLTGTVAATGDTAQIQATVTFTDDVSPALVTQTDLPPSI